tara:strand:- start:323 stop:709 length:387 start_codon:yes stop_codon:yes gene_type:complete
MEKINKKSLGNVNVFLSQGYLFFIREDRNLNFEFNIQQNKYYIFDGRFLVKSVLPGKLCKCTNRDLMLIDNKSPFYKYRNWINSTIPYLETLEGKTIKPHLSIISQNSIVNKEKNELFSLYLFNRILI